MTLVRSDYIKAADVIGCEVEAVMAVASVESNGGGMDPEGFPITLFEGQWFSKLTHGKFNTTNPTLSYPVWTKQFYGKSWREEKVRLQDAILLDRDAAMMSASWGMFQIMGLNFAKCGFPTIQEFVTAMCAGQSSQLDAFSHYIVASHLADELKGKQWATFARLYNGSSYAVNHYDTKLAAAYAQYKKVS